MAGRSLLKFLAAVVVGLAVGGCGTKKSPAPAKALADEPHRVQSFDANWRFLKGDAAGAEQPEFDDDGWRKLDLPHDWAIEGPFDRDNPTGGGGAFLPAGVGWYRKRFTLPPTAAGRRVFVDFDGVMANSDVWINGLLLGHRPYGYVSFRYEITDRLRPGGGANVIAVRADNSAQPASRWYTGAGIYRHVRLVITDAVHLDHWGTFVSTPTVAADRATIRVQTRVVNQSSATRNLSLRVTIADPDGKPVGSGESTVQKIAAGASVDMQQEVRITGVRRWDLEHPQLYRARVEVRAGSATVDDETVPFGIRTFRFEPDTGFWLNDRNLKIYGVCLHEDAGGLGVAVSMSVWERRLATLRSVGVNAIRTAHAPPSPQFLDLCDRMGFLVMDEMFDCWTVGKSRYDYHLYFDKWSHTDTRDTVRRDRNHPSIILYSAGNEIHDTPNAPLAKRILTGLLKVFHQNDPTRPVTQALFRPNVSHDYDNGLADTLDVVGQNYRENEILAAHRQNPSRKIIGTENQHGLDAWLALRDHPEYAGQFLWTGIDYLGESRRWPVVGANSGLLDWTGVVKPVGFQRQSWWTQQPMVYAVRRIPPPTTSPATKAGAATSPADPGYEAANAPSPVRRPLVLFADWSPRDRSPHIEHVEVYSNCPRVELSLNGKPLVSRPKPADDSPRLWRVPYEPGDLKAIATDEAGRVLATHVLRTAGPAARVSLTADRQRVGTNFDDVCFVTATVTDAAGVAVPTGDDDITFTITGPGTIAAVDSADVASHEPFQSNHRRAYLGRCVAIIRATAATGPVTVTAAAAGLQDASVTLNTP